MFYFLSLSYLTLLAAVGCIRRRRS